MASSLWPRPMVSSENLGRRSLGSYGRAIFTHCPCPCDPVQHIAIIYYSAAEADRNFLKLLFEGYALAKPLSQQQWRIWIFAASLLREKIQGWIIPLHEMYTVETHEKTAQEEMGRHWTYKSFRGAVSRTVLTFPAQNITCERDETNLRMRSGATVGQWMTQFNWIPFCPLQYIVTPKGKESSYLLIINKASPGNACL